MGPKERRAQVVVLWHQGLAAKEIAERLGVKPSTIGMDLYQMRQEGVDLPHRKPQPLDGRVAARRLRVAWLWERGFTSAEIAAKVGASESAILTDLRWMRVRGDISARDPHQHPTRRARREKVARLWQEGWTADEIAARLGISRSTLYLDLERLRSDGDDLPFRVPHLIGNRLQKGGGE